eukprot:TRINITY_DN115092_c0_g1_i1.p3 TRINITY_DN115092_c0_g1~~TRINITY_DN115092_c0_g1_i1.p3  ORF type:complete len:108 (+),score=9.41 TRINITY_DN115092_c0_g1_i1:402-725(+)
MELLGGGRADGLDDLGELVRGGLAGEERAAQEELCHDAAEGPYVDCGSVLGGVAHELGRAVVARADVRHVGLALDETLGAAEVAQLDDVGAGVEEEVLGLDVSVADA